MKCVSQWTASDLRWREVELVFIVFFSRWPIANHLYVKLEFYSLDLFHAYFHSVNYFLSGISLVPCVRYLMQELTFAPVSPFFETFFVYTHFRYRHLTVKMTNLCDVYIYNINQKHIICSYV